MNINSLYLLVILASTSLTAPPLAAEEKQCPDTLKHTKRSLVGKSDVDLCKEYLGKVIVVVNTASKCGYTYQYEGLEALYRKYREKGLVVLGFPSNDFGGQEPGTEKQIQDFCRLTYGVEFPMFEKTHASRYNAGPLYKTLAGIAGEYPQWNFHKYIIDRKGNLVASFNSKVEPQSNKMISKIEELL